MMRIKQQKKFKCRGKNVPGNSNEEKTSSLKFNNNRSQMGAINLEINLPAALHRNTIIVDRFEFNQNVPLK